MKRLLVFITIMIVALGGTYYLGSPTRHARSGSGRSPKGNIAPNFLLPDLQGDTVELSRFHGKAVVLNFWATWCGPCREETPVLVELQKKYGANGLQVIGIALDDSGKGAIAEFAKQLNVNYPVLIGTEDVASAYGGILSLPTTFIIGRDGKVLEQIFGAVQEDTFPLQIEAALKRDSGSR
ncbi:MAG: TlpA disulfide reductase family protein [Terriglobales bacterium]